MSLLNRLLTHGRVLPAAGRLFRATTPNATGADTGKWILPESCFAAVGEGIFFESDGTPIAVSGQTILDWEGINKYHILFSLAKGLVVYDPYTTLDATIVKADRYMKLPLYTDTPNVYFNGVDITGSTATTWPGTVVQDYLGNYIKTPTNKPAIQGGRWTGTEWVTTKLDGTPILPSTSQPTRTSGTVLDGSELGPELLTVAQQQCDSGWLVIGESTISGGNLNLISTGSLSQVYVPSVLSIGKTYRLSYTVVSASGQMKDDNSRVLPTALGVNTVTYVSPGTALAFTRVSACNIVLSDASVKEVLPAFTNVFTPSTTFAKFTRANPAVDMPGYLSEPARTNKCTCRKANPVDTTGLTKSGDAAAVLSVVDDTAALTAAGLIGRTDSPCTSGKVYKLDNSLGTINADATVAGTTANVNVHSMSMFARATGGSGGGLNISGGGQYSGTVNSTYAKLTKENFVPPSTTQSLKAVATAGSIVYFILPQLEEGAFATSPICKLQDGSDPLTAITRAGTVLSFPTLGKIRPNNQAYLLTIVPRGTGQSGVFAFSTYTDANNYTAVMIDPTVITYRKRIAGVNTDATVSITHTKDVPITIVWGGTSDIGMRIAARQYTGGAWSSWTDGALVSSAAGKANAIIGATVQRGSLNGALQFTGNVSGINSVDIPAGIPDFITWAKGQMEVA